ncbi:MAG: ATP-dependent DNA helicase [Ruminococcaceae bacterium]|nr:ATP-dependent DNA helicase [Oscillospiraceae bacterium]
MRYNTENCSVELSVRELCLRAYTVGDLDLRHRVNIDSLHIGSEIHARIQKEAGVFYSPEVTLGNTFEYDGIYYSVSGRADGIIKLNGKVTVDEIKSVKAFDFYAPPKDIHIAQMKCYAYFLACRDDLSRLCGRITYVNVDTGKIKYYNYDLEFEELKGFYRSLILKISRTAEFIKNREEEILPKAASLPFPYSELREGQELMIRECYRAIRHGERLFAEAPTGTGKTISALYPAVRALGGGYADKIFYLTAKSSTRREAFRAAEKIFESGAHLRTLVLTAKEQVCLCGGKITGSRENLCNPNDCDFARGYYTRSQNAIFELLSRQYGFTRQIIKEVALKYRVCPYELALDLSEYCDIIVCDYNYVFDPLVYFRRYFSDQAQSGRYIFLLDEAHNLADRARNMYSAELRRSQFEKLYSVIPTGERELDEAFEKIIMAQRSLRRLCRDNLTKTAEGEERGFYMNSAIPQTILSELEKFKLSVEGWMKKNEQDPLCAELDIILCALRRFLAVSEYFDERFLFYTEISGGDTLMKIYCLDTSHIMNILQNRAVSSILFSATLTPSDYFVDLLGGGKNSYSISLPSPFDGNRLLVAVADYLSVRYEDRKKNTKKYANVIAMTASAKAGNYIVYFPSYDMLESVASAFSEKFPKVKLIIQKRNMTQKEKEEFIDSFKDDEDKLRIGFCVLGGSFSEGVDLPGSRLIGTVIFGVGLPGLSNENNIIRDYFETRNGCGYDYAYTFPGMNNVLQAAGRVIRREDDRGVVVLVDDRYASEKYRLLFPEHWKNINYAGNAPLLAENIKKFWSEG